MQETPTASRILQSRIDAVQEAPAIEGVATGDELTMVVLEDGRAGVGTLPEGSVPDVAGESALAVARRGVESVAPPERALGIAALNAIDAPETVRPGLDPFRSLDPAVERVAMVGLFGPVLSHLNAGHVDVFERDPESMAPPADLPNDIEVAIHPPGDAAEIVPESPVLFVTGSTLVYGGLGGYLDAARPDQTVVVVGASASFTPDPLFEAGVDLVGGASVEDVDRLRTEIAAGRSEARLHEVGLNKWAVLDPGTTDLAGLHIE
ncbi:MAG: Rossmann-like domain-containing protein [Halodesulfurarchaeum sp.]